MRNDAMERLDILVGSWQVTMRNAWFLEPADLEVPGTATVEWLGDAFVVFRWTMSGDVGRTGSRAVGRRPTTADRPGARTSTSSSNGASRRHDEGIDR
jgi:hypothetical protein